VINRGPRLCPSAILDYFLIPTNSIRGGRLRFTKSRRAALDRYRLTAVDALAEALQGAPAAPRGEPKTKTAPAQEPARPLTRVELAPGRALRPRSLLRSVPARFLPLLEEPSSSVRVVLWG
jgi:hypothetical protein